MKMKQIFMTFAVAAIAASMSAQTINQTTYWNFDQFVDSKENVAFLTPVNYGGLYIVGHSDTKAATTTTANSVKEAKFGSYTYYTNTGLNLPGGYTSKIATSASEVTKDALAFDAGCAGTLYIQSSGTSAAEERGIEVYFDGVKVKTATASGTAAQVTTVENEKAGTYYITAVKACNIYAMKFVPSAENAFTKEVTLSEYGLSTFSDTHAWAVPEGLEAYYARSIKNDKGKIYLNVVKTDVIPACTGVILRGNGGQKYTLTSQDCGSVVNSKGESNLNISYSLRPVVTDYQLSKNDLKTTKDDNNCYLLGGNDNEAVFAPSAEGTIAAGKAYYCTIGSADEFAKSQSAASAKGISLIFNSSTTGIHQLEATRYAGHVTMYNLAGQKVDDSYKGIILVNGKKYVNK